jgi:hypothetical protein
MAFDGSAVYCALLSVDVFPRKCQSCLGFENSTFFCVLFFGEAPNTNSAHSVFGSSVKGSPGLGLRSLDSGMDAVWP